jgi:TonB family protein
MSAVDLLVRSSVVLAAGFGALWMLRGQSAALRHWTLAFVILLAAAQPIIREALPQWHVVRLPGPAPTSAVGAVAVSTEATFEIVKPAASAPSKRSLSRVTMLLWLAGVAGSFAVLLVGFAWLAWQTLRAVPAGARWAEMRQSVSAALGISTNVRILETHHPALLVTWGLFRPVILLPRGASSWSDERLRLVVAHELAHLARRDWLVQLVAECLRAVYWFNPLFWLACSRLREESEHAADDRVLGIGVGNTSYASHLVDLARSFSVHGRTWLPAPSMARPSTLERRVLAMLNARLNRQPMSPRWRAAAALFAVAVAVPVAAASLGAGAPSGVLKDPSGLPLPAATLRLTALSSDAFHETTSDATGSFQFGEVPDGEYMLSARVPGFQTARQRVQVSPNAPPFAITMQVGTLRETVSIRAAVGAGSDSVARTVETARPGYDSKPKCGSTDVGGNLKPPMKLKDVRPRYLKAWVENNVEGDVLIEAIIGVDGRVRNVQVVSPGNAELEEETMTAVSQWEFSPTWLNCEAIEVRMFVTASFKIER